MLFSALVDADFIETERFYEPDIRRGAPVNIADLQSNLAKYFSKFGAPKTEVNRLRAEVLSAAEEAAIRPSGFFTLTVPTGGGKTLTSLRFALDHAQQNGLRRVIHVSPFTAIIEQVADVFREALGHPEAVLEHHSAFEPGEQLSDETELDRMKQAAQNWDRPIIVTTAVQFFESLFSNRTQKCRKLHNIARSVIIFDEAQSLPVDFLRPCLAALKELVRGYGCSIVLCTATQPAIRDIDGLSAQEGIPSASTHEIAPDPENLHRRLQRVEVKFQGLLENRALIQRMADKRALIIVNNKRHARSLFDEFEQGKACHLSTNMTPVHRRDVLRQIKSGFDGPVISTALIEAGVDLDFPEVWRAVTGLDSIVQAAGRCNREGKLRQLGKVHIFEPEEQFPPPTELRQNAEIARDIMQSYADDPLHPDAIRAYFQRLYWDRDADLDSRNIMKRIAESGNQFDFPFADIAADFRIISETGCPLIIGSGRYGLDEEARRTLKFGKHAGSIARKVQAFTVSVPPRIRDELIRLGAARVARSDDFGDQFVVLKNPRLYHENAGFSAEDAEDLGLMIA